MEIILYNNLSEDNKLNKNIVKIIKLEGALREASSLTNPSILIELNPSNFDSYVADDNRRLVVFNGIKITWESFIYDYIISANYVYIPDFNRYYFINDIISIRNNMWRLNMHVDVLMSYKKEIGKTYALVSRNEFVYNKLLEDNKISYQSNKNVELISDDELDVEYFINLTEELTYDSYNAILCCIRTGAISGVDLPAYKNLSSVSHYATRYAGMTEYYAIPLIRCSGVMGDIYDNDTLKSYVKNIIILPFSINGTPSSDHKIIIGNTEVDVNGIPKNPIYLGTGNINRFKYATIKMPKIESFNDLEPYTKYEIYVPYKGFISIDLSTNSDNHITIFYSIDYDSGQSSYLLYNEEKELIIDEGSCQLGYRLSLDSTNALEIQNQKNSLAISTTMSTLTSLLTIVGGVASQNPLIVAGGVLSGVNAITGAVSKGLQLYDLGATDIKNNSEAIAMYTKIYCRKTTAIKVNDTGYASLYGKPLNEYKKLDDLTGMTIIDDEHLENFGSALGSENEEIKVIFKTGIIL